MYEIGTDTPLARSLIHTLLHINACARQVHRSTKNFVKVLIKVDSNRVILELAVFNCYIYFVGKQKEKKNGKEVGSTICIFNIRLSRLRSELATDSAPPWIAVG